MANVYWLTFRIEQVGNHTTRYDRLMNAVSDLTGGSWWVEPTSFVLFRSESSIDQVAAAISAELDTDRDLALVGMPEFKSARAVGAIRDQDLFKLMPFTKWA